MTKMSSLKFPQQASQRQGIYEKITFAKVNRYKLNPVYFISSLSGLKRSRC